MPDIQLGLVHTPVTPFTDERRIDFATLEKLLEFHLRHGAEALALPMHVGESVSLSDEEQRKMLGFAVRQVNDRVPVIAHTSDSGTSIAASRARYAEETGAAAIVATAPYYWTPPPAMLLEHFVQIASAVRIPFFLFHTPEEMAGVRLTADLVLKLMERIDNFAGIVDAGLDWQFMVNVAIAAKRLRPGFQLVSGTEYMVPAGTLGATGMFSALAGIAPGLVGRLFALCRREQYFEARASQEDVAALRQVVKKAGFAGLKGALRAMGRACGDPRPPNEALSRAEYERLAADLDALPALRDEPRGW
jgi:4-hydroxy-tetrahydrodipicolinate synthase